MIVIIAALAISSSLTPFFSGRTDYHIDGQANDTGDRFPDLWTLQVGVALTDILVPNAGNFTVFPGAHAKGGGFWSKYPKWKKDNSLPDVGMPEQLFMHAGDAVFAHVLLPHRGVGCY
jgi:hypothetical protein